MSNPYKNFLLLEDPKWMHITTAIADKGAVVWQAIKERGDFPSLFFI